MQIFKNQRISSTNPSYLELYFDYYKPKKPKGVVIQIATGMVEHKRHYIWLATELCQHGYSVFIYDHRGHGLSVLEHGSEIYWGEMGVDGFEQAAKDMAKLASHIQNICKGYKHVLLGHSMGSLLARRFMQHNYQPIHALVLAGTPAPFLGLGLCAWALKILRALRVSFKWNINTLFHLHPRVRAMGGSWISRNVQTLRTMRSDPACHFYFSTNSFACLVEGIYKVFYTHAYGPKDVPILLVSGLDDLCGNFGVGVIKARECLKKQGFTDVSLRLFDRDRHKILDEPDRKEVLASILAWLKSKGL
ncbi:alpha/beta fold hydrolase [Helicobacter suis]|uniref:alpha/beta fold hydrolase n=1 Tax=Helicobacter suis TaxID=104628 RepID=UPI00248069EF|nr:alpha/beta hydrolase [Helicobacter suis]